MASLSELVARVRVLYGVEPYSTLGYSLTGPAAEDDIHATMTWWRERCGQDLPAELIDFWRLTDGAAFATGSRLFGPAETWEYTENFGDEDWPDALIFGMADSIELAVHHAGPTPWLLHGLGFNLDDEPFAAYATLAELLAGKVAAAEDEARD